MLDWNSPEELCRTAIILTKLANVWAGVYCCEILTSFGFDREFITRKRPFQWQLAPYFVGRYTLAIGLLCLTIMLNSTGPINCAMLYPISFLMEISVACASVTFAIRTIAIWSSPSVTRSLQVIVLVQVILVLWNTSRSQAQWFDGQGCQYMDPAKTYLTVLILRVYTMFFDGIVLGLNAFKLGAVFSNKRQGRFVRLLIEQGLVYFIVAFLWNAVAVGFLIWRPNSLIGIAGVSPSSVFTVIASCRSVRHLIQLMIQDAPPRFQSPTVATGTLQFFDTALSQEDSTVIRDFHRSRRTKF
ncbi:hypothetical protein CPB83DRAFT_844590 [Crepidotus variabilis]|uniref:Transmembrane protein n=1 Tax=Crepidotus variabilis TaxID=179855 RepID=A0A9P6ERX6_9AGAR|nr:hypothetical protein CPB83DRAFT_844590 [Crepidotus variabilis]